MSKPALSALIQPRTGRTASYLRCAPSYSIGQPFGFANLVIYITNQGASEVHLSAIEVSFPSSTTPAQNFSTDIVLGIGKTKRWIQPSAYPFVMAGGNLQVRFFADGYDEAKISNLKVIAHKNPAPSDSYRFWARVDDLRPGEFWQIDGTSHSQSNFAQLFAYDVGVGVKSGNGYTTKLAGTVGSKNEHYRIYGKPIYAVAKGVVVDGRNDFPENDNPGSIDPAIAEFWTPVSEGGEGNDGNGNFITINTKSETTLYAHMIPGSLNPKYNNKGATIEAGEFIGLAGNSGASSGPHMHIHTNQSGGSPSWIHNPRPMRFRNAHAVLWSKLGSKSQGPWVKLNGRGLPVGSCAVWPSDDPAVAMKEVKVRNFEFNETGRLWVVTMDKRVRTAQRRLPFSGLNFDIDTGAQAFAVAAKGTKAYVIGLDKRVWEGLPSGWAQLPSSPKCSRLTIDHQGNGYPWVVTEQGRIYKFNITARTWSEQPQAGRAKDIAVYRGVPHVIGLDNAIWKSAGAAGWSKFPGTGLGKRIAIDPHSGDLWIVGMNDGVWHYVGSGTWSEHPKAGRAKDLALHGGIPYVIGLDDGLWKSNGVHGWVRMNLVEKK